MAVLEAGGVLVDLHLDSRVGGGGVYSDDRIALVSYCNEVSVVVVVVN